MIDQELLKACVLHPCSITPRMMLIDSMIENGWEEFKAMEAFEPPTISNHLPLTYGNDCFANDCFANDCSVNGIFIGHGSGFGSGYGRGCGYGVGHGRDNSCGNGYSRFNVIEKAQQ